MNEAQTHIYEFSGFRLDVAKRLLLRRDGERVPLTPKAFDTLLYLVEHSGTLLDKDELLRAVWTDTVVEENNLNQHISTLRRVLGEKRDEHRYILTVPGRGYRFIADVSTYANVDEQKGVEHTLDQKQSESSNANTALQSNPRAVMQNRNVWIGLFAGIIIIGMVATAFYFWRARTKLAFVSSIRTIAVLPFTPLVAENRDEALEMGMFLHFAGRDDEAIARLQKTLELAPNFWVAHLTLAKVYTRKRMYPEAIAALNKAREFSGGNTETISLIGYTWAVSGNHAQAQTALDELKSLSTGRYVPPYNIAIVYNGLDEKDEALAWLEKAYEERDVRLTFIKIDPKWDSYRSDSRFADIVKRIGLE